MRSFPLFTSYLLNKSELCVYDRHYGVNRNLAKYQWDSLSLSAQLHF